MKIRVLPSTAVSWASQVPLPFASSNTEADSVVCGVAGTSAMPSGLVRLTLTAAGSCGKRYPSARTAV
ncbi:hypothetical protein [Cellulomonas denverensis]|uniref:hypothetical protein n=1 Tax=Cellulomonas denverensis TaxID=264297 RepID=UPI0035EC8DBB